MQRRHIIASMSAVLTALVLAGAPTSALAAPPDKASPNLMKYCVQGKHIARAVLP